MKLYQHKKLCLVFGHFQIRQDNHNNHSCKSRADHRHSRHMGLLTQKAR